MIRPSAADTVLNRRRRPPNGATIALHDTDDGTAAGVFVVLDSSSTCTAPTAAADRYDGVVVHR